MTVQQEFVVTCNKCGRRAYFEETGRWYFLTQPQQSFCPECRYKSESMRDGTQYDEDYFLRGRASGKSLYEDYRWLPELTVPMCRRIADHCDIHSGAHVLDFGCARGYVVRAMRGLGYEAFGVDVSEWAVSTADDDVKPFISMVPLQPPLFTRDYDWIIAKDVLEHVPYVHHTINELLKYAKCGVFVVVPLSPFEGEKYEVPEYERDVTHCQRHTLGYWINLFLRPGWSIEASYRVPGVKDNYAQYERGNGFITARRIG